MDISFIHKLYDFQNKFPELVIGGSVSLILQNIIPPRITKDVDIISKEKIHINDIFNLNRSRLPRIKTYKYKDIIYDLFINPNREYISYNIYDVILNISPVEEIMKWKYKNQHISKNKKDIEYFLNKNRGLKY